MTDRFLRAPQVREATGLSRTTLWRLERAGDFPRRRQLTPGAVAWKESEIQDWIAARAEVAPAATADAA